MKTGSRGFPGHKKEEWQQIPSNLYASVERKKKRNFPNINKNLRLHNQSVVFAEKLPRDENLEPIVTEILSKGLEEQLQHVRNATTGVDRLKKEDHHNDEDGTIMTNQNLKK